MVFSSTSLPATSTTPARNAQTAQTDGKLTRVMTFAHEQERLEAQKSMAARMSAVADRKKRVEMAERPTARAVPGIVEQPFSIVVPEYLNTYLDQQLTVFRKGYNLRLPISRSESKALERVASAASVAADAGEDASVTARLSITVHIPIPILTDYTLSVILRH